VQADGRTTPFDRAKALKRSGLAASRQTLPLSESPPTQARRCSRSTRNFGLCAARSQLDAEPAGAVSDNPPVIVEGPGKPRLPERRVLRIALALNAAMFTSGWWPEFETNGGTPGTCTAEKPTNGSQPLSQAPIRPLCTMTLAPTSSSGASCCTFYPRGSTASEITDCCQRQLQGQHRARQRADGGSNGGG